MVALDGCGVDGLTHERDEGVGWLGCVEASADGGEDRDFVAVVEDAGARTVLLIDGDGGGVKRGCVGEALATEDREKIVDRSTGSEIAPVAPAGTIVLRAPKASRRTRMSVELMS